jgi:hypothetical protein
MSRPAITGFNFSQEILDEPPTRFRAKERDIMDWLKAISDLKAISVGLKAKDFKTALAALGDLLIQASGLLPSPGTLPAPVATGSALAAKASAMSGAHMLAPLTPDDAATHLDGIVAELEATGPDHVGKLGDGTLLKIILPILLDVAKKFLLG